MRLSKKATQITIVTLVVVATIATLAVSYPAADLLAHALTHKYRSSTIYPMIAALFLMTVSGLYRGGGMEGDGYLVNYRAAALLAGLCMCVSAINLQLWFLLPEHPSAYRDPLVIVALLGSGLSGLWGLWRTIHNSVDAVMDT